jgi:hypothetical protein
MARLICKILLHKDRLVLSRSVKAGRRWTWACQRCGDSYAFETKG